MLPNWRIGLRMAADIMLTLNCLARLLRMPLHPPRLALVSMTSLLLVVMKLLTVVSLLVERIGDLILAAALYLLLE